MTNGGLDVGNLRKMYKDNIKDIEDSENGVKKEEEEIKSEADMFREMGLDPDSEFFWRDVKPEDFETESYMNAGDFAKEIEKFKEAEQANEIIAAAHNLYLNLKDISPETQKILDENKRNAEDLCERLEGLIFYKEYELYNTLMADFGVFRIGHREKDMIEIKETVGKEKEKPKTKKIQKKVW